MRRCWINMGVLAVMAITALWPAPAAAHGGLTVLRTVAGPYRIAAQVIRVDGGLEEAVAVTDLDSGELLPVVFVSLSLVDENGRTLGPYGGRPVGRIVDVQYPEPDGGGWRVRLSVLGPQGTVEVEHRYAAPAKEWAVGSGLPAAVVTVLAGILAFAVPVFASGASPLTFRLPGRKRGGADAL